MVKLVIRQTISWPKATYGWTDYFAEKAVGPKTSFGRKSSYGRKCGSAELAFWQKNRRNESNIQPKMSFTGQVTWSKLSTRSYKWRFLQSFLPVNLFGQHFFRPRYLFGRMSVSVKLHNSAKWRFLPNGISGQMNGSDELRFRPNDQFGRTTNFGHMTFLGFCPNGLIVRMTYPAKQLSALWFRPNDPSHLYLRKTDSTCQWLLLRDWSELVGMYHLFS